MNKIWILLFAMSFAICSTVFAQTETVQIFSTQNAKKGKFIAKFSEIKDNRFTLTLSVAWTNENFEPEYDPNSIITADKKKLQWDFPEQITLLNLNEASKPYFVIKDQLKLNFKISEKFQGGTVTFSIPATYVTDELSAAKPENHWAFLFSKPRLLKAQLVIDKAMIADITPPFVEILKPAKVGFKPIITETEVDVIVKAADDSGIQSVEVNGVSAKRIADSTYLATIPLRTGGENEIKAIVTDMRRNTSSQSVFVTCADAFSAVIEQQKALSEQKKFISDVDSGLVYQAPLNTKRFALIIGNEDYTKFQTNLQSEANVEFANSDARSFALYAEKVLGVPQGNITLITDAISTQMKREIEKFLKIAQYSGGEAELIFYYAGHGFPDAEGNAYIMPVDVSGTDVQNGILLTNLYQSLTKFPTKRVTVFLDACFSGGGRNQGLLSARAVKVKPKEQTIGGNLVIFSASSGSQVSLPYKDQKHGMFTYFLLKKLKEAPQGLNYKELGNYIINEVQLNSAAKNYLDQNPQILLSPAILSVWENWVIK